MHRVVDVDVSLRILHHAVGVAVFDAGRQFTPIVDGLIRMLAAAQHGSFGPRLVGGYQDRGRQRSSRLQKSSTRSVHLEMFPLTGEFSSHSASAQAPSTPKMDIRAPSRADRGR